MAATGQRSPATTARTSRLRLIVIEAVVVALFATLGVRLYYLQVAHGESYQAQAASQSKREIVQQPVRGLIVDAMGRPLVANRNAWVVSIDRSVLDKHDESEQTQLLRRVSKVVDVPVADIRSELADWTGSQYQPVPVASDVAEEVALRILEQPEDFPGVVAAKQTVRSYPHPYGVNAADVLGYLSPVTEDEYDQAQDAGDDSVNATSVVGRAGVEKQYDSWLRGMPGYTSVTVDSQGREIGQGDSVPAQPGDTLVTSIDARVQSVAEKQLAGALTTARKTFDPVTGRNYEADSGAVVVLEATTGRVVATASQPTYDPEVWVGGISQKQLDRLYSEEAGNPLVGRATQGQFAPGSTWKPFMTTGALSNGYAEDTRLNCSSAFRVGNRDFKNYESGAYGSITFAKALEVSCNTFFYRIGYDFWVEGGGDPQDVDAPDPLVETAKSYGFGRPTGIDLPGEASGRIADRSWKRDYYEAMKDHYCTMDEQDSAPSPWMQLFAHEFCLEGWYYRAGDAVNFSIGQGDTLVTPMQLARAYAALSNGGTLYEPRVAKAIVSADGTVLERIKPKAVGRVPVKRSSIDYVDQALLGTTRSGTLAWRFDGFPLDQVQVRGKTGSAEVQGKQSTSWVATYDENYVVIMMVSQGGTGSGTSGPAVRKIWEALYGVRDGEVRPAAAAIPGVTPPTKLPHFGDDGSIMPPSGPGTRTAARAQRAGEETR